MKSKLLETPNLHVNYSANDKLLVQTWYGQISRKQFDKISEILTFFYDKYDIQLCISDIRKADPVLPETGNYTLEAMAKCYLRGLKRLAVIDSVLYPINKNSFVETMVFDSLDTAEQWLLS